jgi:serine/threonine-protein kinase RsbW
MISMRLSRRCRQALDREGNMTMTANYTESIAVQQDELDELVIDSQLSEMSRLAGWVEAVGGRYGISERARFAMNLCLEEAVSNSIRHGYEGRAGREVRVNFSEARAGFFVVEVEDDAPHFDPLHLPLLPKVDDQSPDRLGGQGIRLMSGFSDLLEYEPTETGNRLRIGFLNETQ